MPKEDEPGFDPFADPDEYREEHPLHDVVSVATLVGVFEAQPDSAPPPPMQIKCGLCFKTFTSKASWFFRRWQYGRLCLNCGDGNRLPADFKHHRPPTRDLNCPACGIRRGVEPAMKYNLWHYELTCANCGEFSLATYRIKRSCDTCQETYTVDDRYPVRQCRKCREPRKVF